MNNNNTFKTSYMKRFIPYALAAFLIGLVGGLTTVMGPAFVHDINLDYNNTTWTALALAVSSAVASPILGKLSDMFGRRTTLFLGMLIFILGNFLSAIASSLFFMIIARLITGIGTAAIAPTIMSFIITEFPPHAIAKGFSLYMLISSSAVIFGPSIGSIVLEIWNWRVLMWLCVAISVLFLIICYFNHDKISSASKKSEKFDGFGSFFIVTTFSLLLCIPSFGQNFGWTSNIFLIISFMSIISLAGLIISEKKAVNPILSGSFMKRKSFILPVIILFLTQGLMQANMTNVIVFVNYTQPNNTVISGYAISIMYLGMSIGSIILGPLADKYEPKNILKFSLLLTGAGCAVMLLFTENSSVLILALALGVLGFGLGANATIFMKVVLSNLSTDTAGSATGVYGLFRDLAAPFGVAVFVPMFTNKITGLTNNYPNISASSAAVSSIQMLAGVELICVFAGILIVFLLPKIHHKNKEDYIS